MCIMYVRLRDHMWERRPLNFFILLLAKPVHFIARYYYIFSCLFYLLFFDYWKIKLVSNLCRHIFCTRWMIQNFSACQKCRILMKKYLILIRKYGFWMFCTLHALLVICFSELRLILCPILFFHFINSNLKKEYYLYVSITISSFVTHYSIFVIFVIFANYWMINSL